MEEQNSNNKIEISTDETEIKNSNEEVPEVPKELTLREKVFAACNNMREENKKITRRSVRAGTGGSDRDVQKYINEWHESQSLEVPEEGEIVVKSSESVVHRKEKEVPVNNSNYNEQPKNEAANLARKVSERAAALIVAEEMGLQFLLENPDKLPEDLKQLVANAKNKTADKIDSKFAQYNPDFFGEMVIAQFQ